jgi:hypothetical protein
MGLFIGVDKPGQSFGQIGQGRRFVLADLIDLSSRLATAFR